MNDKIVTDKFGIRIYPGDKVYAIDIAHVKWTGYPKPLEGIIHSYAGPQSVYFLPNEPDPSSNGFNNARNHQPYGWLVRTYNIQAASFIIDEPPSIL